MIRRQTIQKRVTDWKDLPLVMSIKDVAAIISVHPENIRKRLVAGEIKGFKVGPNRRITKDNLRAYMEGAN